MPLTTGRTVPNAQSGHSSDTGVDWSKGSTRAPATGLPAPSRTTPFSAAAGTTSRRWSRIERSAIRRVSGLYACQATFQRASLTQPLPIAKTIHSLGGRFSSTNRPSASVRAPTRSRGPRCILYAMTRTPDTPSSVPFFITRPASECSGSRRTTTAALPGGTRSRPSSNPGANARTPSGLPLTSIVNAPSAPVRADRA